MGAPADGSPRDGSTAFRERARLEADRYGSDPWVFVRELLQNARDAGADKVRFHVPEPRAGEETVVCQDNGEGMTFEHARRYLFALYASSKEGKKNQAGKFGVGFWSILRFEPTSIVIRSRPRHGGAWGVSFDGSLEHARAIEPPSEPGTEIVLRRPRGEAGLAHRIYDAVWQSARYLSQRDDPEAPLPVEVNGRSANAAFELPAPSASFQRRRLRGVVGLGSAPRVELFSRGLRVRSAACLEDLLSPSGRHTSWMRVHFADLPGGLAPQALLESDDLEVMLSRSDARDTRALTRLVRFAQRELERLIERQLLVSRPQPWWRRALDWIADRARAVTALRPVDLVMIGLLAVVFMAIGWRAASSRSSEIAGAAAVSMPMRLYSDLGRRYRGPRVDVLNPRTAEPIALRYKPPQGQYNFAALTFSRLAADGSPVRDPVAEASGRYPMAACTRNCVEIELPLRSAGPVRIPVPTGHRLVAGSVALGGQQPRLRASADGEPIAIFPAPVQGVLRYQTVPAADPTPPPPTEVAAGLPRPLQRRARRLSGVPVAVRVAELVDLVRGRISYDTSAAGAERHRRALGRGEGFIRRTLAIGAGDCDVINGLLTALLQAAGVPARLAVGYQSDRGGVLPWLHAWAEYRDERGRWLVADATETGVQEVAVGAVAVRRSPRPGTRAPAGSADLDEPPVADPSASDRGGESRHLPPVDPGSAGVAAAASPASPDPASAGVGTAEIAAPPGPDPGGAASAAAADPKDLPPAVAAPPPPPAWLASWPVRLIPALLLGGLIWVWIASRTRRRFSLDARADLSKLLQGVLEQPGAFRRVDALFLRPLIPLADGRAISLHRARQLASRARLFCTRDRPALAQTAMRARATVLDDRTEEGRTVARALGAVDLDLWASMIEASVDDPLLDGVNRILRRQGEEWAVRASTKVNTGVAAVDLSLLGGQLPGLHGTRLVLVDAHAPWLAEAGQLYGGRTQAAFFMVLDQLSMRLSLPETRREPLLGACAQQVVLEAFAP